ncbi:divergent polysaccharide deacetylase family protein [Rheinheimera sp.]|uniref:divergent polysaccharide deacetylase family protein n=1 Tax=Rheinheimera sp. TaxID=1869214 RepID=UPI0027372681|nr:divergent polysaccharide deacetylase family protein [Rheinheimera sp.]MDP2714901.1 divergent polysaccharide deacetylase family protein [Rheinheimera sp.]
MRLVLILLIVMFSVRLQSAVPDVRIAIIIDDIGYQKADLQLVDLPFPLTYAVLPHTPYGQRAARQAFQQQKDVMLHMPMEASNGKALGPGALTANMTKQQVQQTLQAALADIPYAIGINNHMGSFYTEQELPMAWTMEYLSKRQLFFVDSLTTSRSKAGKYARQFGVTNLSRHVFLDNEQTETAIGKQFDLLLRIARKRQTAIAIAHPYPETYRFLRQQLPKLQKQGVLLVGISELLPQNHDVVAAGYTAPAISAPQ